MKGDMRRQGEGGSSRKFLIKEEGRLLFTWLEEVGGGGGLLEIFISNIFFPPPSTEIKMGPSLISKKTRAANFKCTM